MNKPIKTFLGGDLMLTMKDFMVNVFFGLGIAVLLFGFFGLSNILVPPILAVSGFETQGAPEIPILIVLVLGSAMMATYNIEACSGAGQVLGTLTSLAAAWCFFVFVVLSLGKGYDNGTAMALGMPLAVPYAVYVNILSAQYLNSPFRSRPRQAA
jgi:hypothetical protein